MSYIFSSPGLIRPDPVEVIRGSIISIFSPEVPRNDVDACRLCKKTNRAANIKVRSVGGQQSRRLLRGTLQSLLLHGHAHRYNYRGWGGRRWELRLCGECFEILRTLSDKYFELEKMRREFEELRGMMAKEIVVNKLGIGVELYKKWEGELRKSEETVWRDVKDVAVGGNDPMSPPFHEEEAEAAVDVDLKEEEEEMGNFFEEMEIEPEAPEPLPVVVASTEAESAVDVEFVDIILPSHQEQQQQTGEEERTTEDVSGSNGKTSKVSEECAKSSDEPNSGAGKHVEDEAQVFSAGKRKSTSTLKTYGRNRNKKEMNPTDSVDPPPPLEVLAVCTKGHGHHRKAVNNEVNLPGLRKELAATMLSTRSKPAITYGRKPAAAAFPPQKKSFTERPKEVRNENKEAPWRMPSTFFDETEGDGASGLENDRVRSSEIVIVDDIETLKGHVVDLSGDNDDSSDISVPDMDPLATEDPEDCSKNDLHSCPHCWKDFKTLVNLDMHISRTHPGEWEKSDRRQQFLRCSLCPSPPPKYYKCESTLKSHMRNVHKVGVVVYPCRSCPEKFDGPVKLLRHREEAHDFQPPPKGDRYSYSCSVCGRKNGSKKALAIHMENSHRVIDASSFRLQCSHCEETFTKQCDLDVHLVKVHFLESASHPRCQYCLKSVSKENVSSHVQQVHKVDTKASASENSPQNIHCSVCKSMTAQEEGQNEQKFSSVEELEDHLKSKEHVDLVESLGRTNVFCGVCRLSFRNDTAELAEHLRSEEHTREQCEVSRIMNAASVAEENSNTSSAFFCVPCRIFCQNRRHSSMKHLRLVAKFRGAWIVNKIPKLTAEATEVFKCPKCLRVFGDKSYLKNHVRKMHKACYPCEYCDLKFKERKVMLSHLRVHRDQMPLKAVCPHCGKGFLHKTRLSTHIRIYHTGDPTICELCGKPFSTPAALRSHINLYHETNLKCSLCEMSFKKAPRLRRHSYLQHKEEYTKDNPFVCLVCFHKFPLQEDLDNHSAAHDSTRCKICPNKVFGNIAELRKHMKVKHDSKRRKELTWPEIKCDSCDKVSVGHGAAWNHRMSHERKNSPALFPCGECGKKFYLEKRYNSHIKKTGHTNQ